MHIWRKASSLLPLSVSTQCVLSPPTQAVCCGMWWIQKGHCLVISFFSTSQTLSHTHFHTHTHARTHTYSHTTASCHSIIQGNKLERVPVDGASAKMCFFQKWGNKEGLPHRKRQSANMFWPASLLPWWCVGGSVPTHTHTHAHTHSSS